MWIFTFCSFITATKRNTVQGHLSASPRFLFQYMSCRAFVNAWREQIIGPGPGWCIYWCSVNIGYRYFIPVKGGQLKIVADNQNNHLGCLADNKYFEPYFQPC